MTARKITTLASALRGFFTQHLPQVRGASPHTVRSYRDSLALLLRFAAAHRRQSVAQLDLDALAPDVIIAFLNDREQAHRNRSSTRNVRLAAVHAFFRFVASVHPEHLELCQRILAVPFKRSTARVVEYLEYHEIQAALLTIDRTARDGRRDYALLATMFNTGARVQEILDLRPVDVQLVSPAHVRLVGKGRKERLCPLWPQTAQLLRAYISERGLTAAATQPLFVNHRGAPLTRFGVHYLLRKYCHRARTTCPSLAGKRLHPHSLRHSAAVHLLRAGVDLVTISHWLGHASPNTTHRYAAIDLETKRAALSKAEPADTDEAATAWRSDATILEWLSAL
jgi:site-specific recombinase XerD